MLKGMRARRILGICCILLALISVGLTGVILHVSGSAQTDIQQLPPAQVRNFTLYVRSTWLKMPDGQKIYVFGYTDDPKGPAKIPGPPIVVNEGDTVNLTLNNDQDPTKTQYNPDGSNPVSMQQMMSSGG